MPHVYCLREPAVIGLHVISDGIIAASYFAIPVILLLLLRRRQDLVFPWLFGLFGAFIFACGSTHLLSIWTLWHPIYRFEGVVKAITAVVSLMTAVCLYRLLPSILRLPSPAQFEREIEDRKQAEYHVRQLNLELEDRVRLRTEELAKSNLHLQTLNASFRKSELQYRILVEAMPQLVWTADESGQCDFMSGRWAEYTGIAKQDHLGHGWVQVLHPEDREPTLQCFLSAVATRGEYNAEYRIRKYDGTYRWFKARGLPIDDEAISFKWLGTCTDVHSEKLATTALITHSRQLEDLAFATAHHLQEPLRILGLQSQTLVRQVSSRLSDEEWQLVGSMEETTRSLRQLLRDFLAYSEANIMPMDRKIVPLSALVAKARDGWQSPLEAIGAVLECQKLEFPVEVNAQPMQMVFEHLIGNAIKYRDARRPLQIRISALETLEGIVVSVADNGIGIDRRFHESIFGLFKRLHTAAEYPGTGLGLALCQRILDLHGQRIWVESAPGAGSTFRLTLRKVSATDVATFEARSAAGRRQSIGYPAG